MNKAHLEHAGECRKAVRAAILAAFAGAVAMALIMTGTASACPSYMQVTCAAREAARLERLKERQEPRTTTRCYLVDDDGNRTATVENTDIPGG